MGMFDTVYVARELLPITDEQYKQLDNWSDDPTDAMDFQTKDLENLLNNYYISEHGTLEVEEYDGSYKDRSDRKVIPDYHGFINFYTSIKDPNEPYGGGWVEFSAKFTDGKLVEIKLIEWREP